MACGNLWTKPHLRVEASKGSWIIFPRSYCGSESTLIMPTMFTECICLYSRYCRSDWPWGKQASPTRTTSPSYAMNWLRISTISYPIFTTNLDDASQKSFPRLTVNLRLARTIGRVLIFDACRMDSLHGDGESLATGCKDQWTSICWSTRL